MKDLEPPENGPPSTDIFEVGLAADVRSITLEGFDSVFALLRLYSIASYSMQ